MIDNWKICYVATYPNGEMLDSDNPFKTANINAKTSAEAIEKLKEEFRGCKIAIHGTPMHSLISEHEYETTKLQI